MGFDPLLNQRQLPPAFPRYPRLRTLPDTVDELAALLDRLLSLRSVLECKHLHQLMVRRLDPRPVWMGAVCLNCAALPPELGRNV